MAALMAIRIATGWEPNDAEVIVGTSGGAYTAALVRNDALNLDSMVKPHDERGDVAERSRRHVYTKSPGVHVRRWVRHGIAPGLRRPGLTLLMGSPARYEAKGLADWVTSQIGEDAAARWPDEPTAIVAYDLAEKNRIVFGTETAPEVGIADAVAASAAIPLVFRPYDVDGSFYVDGGVASGTHADLVLGLSTPLDLILILAPFAAEVQRMRARFHEKLFDRVGQNALNKELALIEDAWPHCDVVTLTPSPSVQNAMRPNPMDASRAVATFTRTLISMKRTLAHPEVWERLDHHLNQKTGVSSPATG
jgi:NTE family protein